MKTTPASTGKVIPLPLNLDINQKGHEVYLALGKEGMVALNSTERGIWSSH